MACERFRDALADVAAGEPAPAGVEAHLATCEACRAELAGLRRALAVADAEMAGLLAAEPTPELAARIRQAVAEAESRGPALPHELSSAWRFGWLWPGMAAAATLLVALAVAVGRGTESTPAPRVAVDAARPGSVVPSVHGRAAGRLEPGPSHVDAAARARGDGASARSRSADRRAIPAEPEVLVPPGEVKALLRFAEHLQRRSVPTDSLLVADLSVPLPEPKALEIAPLEIVPLDPAETSGTD